MSAKACSTAATAIKHGGLQDGRLQHGCLQLPKQCHQHTRRRERTKSCSVCHKVLKMKTCVTGSDAYMLMMSSVEQRRFLNLRKKCLNVWRRWTLIGCAPPAGPCGHTPGCPEQEVTSLIVSGIFCFRIISNLDSALSLLLALISDQWMAALNRRPAAVPHTQSIKTEHT